VLKVIRSLMSMVVLALPISIVLFLYWASDRGFDITDEGYYLLVSQFPAEVRVAPNGGFVFTTALFHLVGGNVVAFRRVGLVLTIACALILYAGIERFWRSAFAEKMTHWLQRSSEAGFVLLGTLLIYAWFLLTPSYNLVNLWACSAWAGFLLLGMAGLRSSPTRPWRAAWALAAAGWCITFSFFAKFPTGISLLVLSGLALWILSPRGRHAKWVAGALVGVGIALGLSTFFCFGLPPAEWWARSGRGVRYLDILLQTPMSSTRLSQYFFETRDAVFRPALADFWVLDAILVVSAVALEVCRRWLKIAVGWADDWVLVIVVVVAGWLSYRRGFWLGVDTRGLPRFYVSWLILLLVAISIGTARRWLAAQRRGRTNLGPVLAMACLLFCLPFAAAFGTSNPLHVNIAMNLAGWFGLTLLLFRGLAQMDGRAYAVAAGTLVLAVLASAQIVTGILRTPYRLNTGILEQSEPTEIGVPPTRLKLDAETSQFFRELRALAAQNGFKPGDDVLAFFDMPGVVFALGGRSPVIPWYTGGNKGSKLADEWALGMLGRERLARAFVFQTASSTSWLEGLRRQGIAFPANYVLCGELKIPYNWSKERVRLWRPLGHRVAETPAGGKQR